MQTEWFWGSERTCIREFPRSQRDRKSKSHTHCILLPLKEASAPSEKMKRGETARVGFSSEEVPCQKQRQCYLYLQV